jgi:hypothetical protein
MSNVNDDDSPRDGESVTVEESRSWLGRLGQSGPRAQGRAASDGGACNLMAIVS